MLAQPLHNLGEGGCVQPEARPVVPSHVEYSLPPDGDDLNERLRARMRFAVTCTPVGEPAVD